MKVIFLDIDGVLNSDEYFDKIEGLNIEGIEKQIFEMIYLYGMTQQEAGTAIGYTQARVSQIIYDYLKDL